MKAHEETTGVRAVGSENSSQAVRCAYSVPRHNGLIVIYDRPWWKLFFPRRKIACLACEAVIPEPRWMWPTWLISPDVPASSLMSPPGRMP